jgi:predicted ATPase
VVALAGAPGIGKSRLLEEFRHNVTGQAFARVGEPGIGKARLLAEFRRDVRGQTVTYVTGACQPGGRATSYLPLRSLVRQMCGLSDTDDAATQRCKVRACLQGLGVVPDDWAPPLLHLLGIPDSRSRVAGQSAHGLRVQTFEALHRLFLHSSAHQPLVVEVEDVHWIDATSEAYLTALVERFTPMPILLLVTYRPCHQPTWLTTSSAMHITLSPLAPRDAQRLVQRLLPPSWRVAAVQQALVTHTHGNPLFLEELARFVGAQDAGMSLLNLPGSLQAVQQARVHQLPEATRQVLQAAAVIGPDVPLALLQALVALPEPLLLQHLHALQTHSLLYESRPESPVMLTFQHILLQEVAYQSMPSPARQQAHAQAAMALADFFPNLAAAEPERVAQHYMAAGLGDEAAAYWQQAGQRAQVHAATVEAMAHFSQGLDALAMLPDTPERVQRRQALRQALSGGMR